MVNAKLKAAFEPSAPSCVSCTNDIGKLTDLPDVIEHRSLSNWTWRRSSKCRSICCRFHFKCDATFRPSILRAICLRPNFRSSFLSGAVSMSGVAIAVLVELPEAFSGATDRNVEIKSIGRGPAWIIVCECIENDQINVYRYCLHSYVVAYLLVFFFSRCSVSSAGFNRNSNQKIVSASNGTDVGFNGLSISLNLLQTTNNPSKLFNTHAEMRLVHQTKSKYICCHSF